MTKTYNDFLALKRMTDKSQFLEVGQVASALYDNSGIKSRTAKSLGVSTPTLDKFMSAHPELEEVRRNAKERVSDIAEQSLVECVKQGKPWAVRWWLKTQATDRGYAERREITGKDGKDLFEPTKEDAEDIMNKFLSASASSKKEDDKTIN